MQSIVLHPRLSPEGIDFIREAMAQVFIRGQNGKGLDPFEQTEIDRKIVIEEIDREGCEIEDISKLRQLETECHLLLEALNFGNKILVNSDLVETLKRARSHQQSNIINARFTKLRDLVAMINGHDFCYSKIGINHPLDDALEEAMIKIKSTMKK